MNAPAAPPPPAAADVSAETEKLLQAGFTASQANEPLQAIRCFEQASATSPASALPQFLLASELASMGRVDEAEAAFANSVLLAPAFDLARYQLGLLQFSSGRAAVALVTWQLLFALVEDNALLHFVRGFAALALDDPASARVHFEAGLERNRENEALSADIRKVLERMDLPAAPAPNEADSALQDREAGNHILISNYGKVGTLH